MRPFSRRPRWWLAIVQIALLLATLVSPAIAAEEPAPMTGTQLIDLLRTYQVVRGDPSGNLNLDRPITRAEMITIVVRAVGGESTADLYQRVSSFSDAEGHWAQGYIAYAYFQKLVKGDGNNLVRPNDFISYAEALTLVLRVVGKEPTSGQWPLNIMLEAMDLKILPEGVTAGNLSGNAIRGPIFQSLARAMVTVTTASGKTFLQQYLDQAPPVLSVAQQPASTKETSVKVSGTVQGASSVTVNGQPAQLTGETFSANVSLAIGPNEITVVAVDLANNKTTKTVSVTRVPPIASLEFTGAARVKPGAPEKYTIVAKDSEGKVVGLEGVTAEVTGNIGTFDVATGTLRASSTPGRGKITLKTLTLSKSLDVEVMGLAPEATHLGFRQVNNGLPVSINKPMTVVIEVRNINGQRLETDYGRQVTLVATGLTGLNVTPAIATTEAGLATFTVTSPMTGIVNLQAVTTGITGSAYTAEFGTNMRVRLSADPGSVTIGSVNNFSRIRATLVDENGTAIVNNTEADIAVQLSASGTDGALSDQYLRILRGHTGSWQGGDEGIYTVGAQGGTVTVTGVVTSGQRITVDPTSLGTSIPSIGSGSKFDITAFQPYTPGQFGNLYIRLVDGNGHTIPGQFAYQLSVETSNSDPKTNGIPAGVSITLGETGLTPISDGIAEGSAGDGADVIGRTVGGVSTLRIHYTRPGQVYLTVVPVGGSTTAYASDGTVGTATYPSVSNQTYTLNFSQSPTSVRLKADSDGFGNGQPAGATTQGRTITLTAMLTDSQGNWTPGTSATVTLTKVSGTSTTATGTSAVAVDGKAQFTVQATAASGEDVYKVSANLSGTPESNQVTLQVQNTAPAAPSVIAIRGTNNGIPGTLNYISPNDTGMEIELGRDAAQHYAVVRVYREGHGTPVYTSEPIDMTGPAPRVTVPKSVLPGGVNRYQITLRNGFAESPRSVVTSQVTTAVVVSNFSFTNAKYQRSTQQLTVSGSGFSNTTDTVNPALMTIRDASTGQSISLAGAQVTVNNYSQLTLNFTGITAITDALGDLTKFSGNDVTLTASAGWYTRVNGEQSAAITAGGVVGPMANIRDVVYDRSNSRLYLNGEGFTSVNIDFSKLKLQADGATDITLNAFSASRISDSQWMLSLTPSAVTALDATGTYALFTQNGWAYDSSWTQPTLTPLTGLTLYSQVALSSVTYNKADDKVTITGSGFTSGAVQVGSLQFVNKNNGQTVTLSGTASVVNDGTIEITLDSAEATALENTTNFAATHSIYLNGSAGWFVKAGRSAAPIPDRMLRLFIQ